MTNEEFLKELNDETTLRALRDAADKKLQTIKEANRAKEIKTIADKFVGKYLISYGHTFAGGCGSTMTKNEDDITIIHVNSIDFTGKDYFRCDANVLKIEYDSEHEWLSAGLNCSDFAQINIRCYKTPSFDVRDSDKFEIIDKTVVNEIVKTAIDCSNMQLTQWNDEGE